MHREQRQQTHDLLRQHNIQQALFARPESTTWLTGFAPPIYTGPNLFAASYPLVWYDNGHFTLIVVDSFAELAAPFGKEPDAQVVTYLGRSLDRPISSGEQLLTAFNALTATKHSGKIGIERAFTGDLIATQLRDGKQEIVAIDGWLEPLRMIKTEEELVVMRRNFALTDIGHAAARAAVAVGKREIDIWNALHSAIQVAAGRVVPVGNDCIVGHRPVNDGGWPLDYEIMPNDSVLVDISVVLDGYWSDSAGTYYAGKRTSKQEKMRQTALEALDLAISLARPGAVAKDIDQRMRQFIEILTSICANLSPKLAIRFTVIIAGTASVSPVTKRRALCPIMMKSYARVWCSCLNRRSISPAKLV